ncbi:MAG: GGDEF domain-containing protein [Desulfomonilaceae bacterium]|nr:GGDEF domain-containing protein [Desulfomonilaceae bacterium]
MADPKNPEQERMSPHRRARQREYRAVGLLLILGMLVWIAQSTAHYVGSHDGVSFRSIVDYASSPTIIISFVGIICFLAYGIYLSRMMKEVRQAEDVRENLISFLTQAQDALHYQATHDSLTGLWNRAAILECFEQELARTRREDSVMSVIIADVDHFKLINDGYGHQAGDAVLREIAQRLKSCLRTYDAVGRYGGEEFLMIFPGCDAEQSGHIAERLVNELRSKPIRTSEGSFDITMSFGIVSLDGSREQDVDSIIRLADQALYNAKRAGRNRVERA